MKYLIYLFCILFSSTALANVEANKGGKPYGPDPRLGGAGTCEGGHRVAVGTSELFVGTSSTVPAATPNPYDRPRLFTWGSVVHISCAAAANFCFVQEDGLSSGDETITVDATLRLDDSISATTGEGYGGCFSVEAGSSRSQVVTPYQTLVSSRSMKCDGTAQTASSPADTGYPCDDDADCFYTPTSGRCDPGRPDGVFIMHEAAAATNCTICVDL